MTPLVGSVTHAVIHAGPHTHSFVMNPCGNGFCAKLIPEDHDLTGEFTGCFGIGVLTGHQGSVLSPLYRKALAKLGGIRHKGLTRLDLFIGEVLLDAAPVPVSVMCPSCKDLCGGEPGDGYGDKDKCDFFHDLTPLLLYSKINDCVVWFET